MRRCTPAPAAAASDARVLHAYSRAWHSGRVTSSAGTASCASSDEAGWGPSTSPTTCGWGARWPSRCWPPTRPAAAGPRAVRARVARRRLARPPPHPAHLRGRRGRRPALHRHALRARAGPRRPHRARRAAAPAAHRAPSSTRSPARSTRPTPRASSTATSSPATSSSRPAPQPAPTTPTCPTSADQARRVQRGPDPLGPAHGQRRLRRAGADREPADRRARADIYSLGCVLYECLAGTQPYPRDTEMATLYAHVQAPPPSLAEARPELPPAIDAVIARALAKDPAERYASAGELARALAVAATPDAAARHLTRGFLFADLRGYTAYVEAHGDAAAADPPGRVPPARARRRAAVRRRRDQDRGRQLLRRLPVGLRGRPLRPRARGCRGRRHDRASRPSDPRRRRRPRRRDGRDGRGLRRLGRQPRRPPVRRRPAAGEVLVSDTVRGLTRTSRRDGVHLARPQAAQGHRRADRRLRCRPGRRDRGRRGRAHAAADHDAPAGLW